MCSADGDRVVSRLKKREVEMAAAWKETGFDVLVHILSFLSDTHDVGRCALVCRAWREAADSHVLWRSIVTKLRYTIHFYLS
jgi:hypothetical protein